MIRVFIKNFRTYTVNPETETGLFCFEFHGGVNLLAGPSGAGKTTVFHALRWCMYKKGGHTPLYQDKSGDTLVRVELPGEVGITRRAPGSHLNVRVGVVEYEGDEAQRKIVDLYGAEHVWRTCNYVPQGHLNALLGGELTDAQRWEVLYAITLENGGARGRFTLDALKAEIRARMTAGERRLGVIESSLADTSRTLERKREGERELGRRREDAIAKGGKGYAGLAGVSAEELSRLSALVADPLYASIPPARQGEALEETVRRGREAASLAEEQMHAAVAQLENARAEAVKMESRVKTIRRALVETETRQRDLRRSISEYEAFQEHLLPLSPHVAVVSRGENLSPRHLASRFASFAAAARRFRRLVQTTPGILTVGEEEIASEKDAARRVRELRDIEARIGRATRDLLPKLPSGKRLDPEGSWLGHLGTSDGRVRLHCPLCKAGLSGVVSRDGRAVEDVQARPEVDGGEVILLGERLYREVLTRESLLDQRTALAKEEIPPLPCEEAALAVRWDNWEWWNGMDAAHRATLEEIARTDNWPCEKSVDALAHTPVPSLATKEEYEDASRHLVEERLRETEMREELRETEVGERARESLALTAERCRLEWRRRDIEKTEAERALARHREVEGLWATLTAMGIRDATGFRVAVDAVRDVERLDAAVSVLLEDVRELEAVMESRTREQTDILAAMLDAGGLLGEIEQVESTVLDEGVQRISSLTNAFLEHTFDSPLSITLDTERVAKSTQKKSHRVSVRAHTSKPGGGGALVERTLDGFSGGELDRISLGFSSAISELSPFPMLLLDECISSLDTEMKDRTIRALRQQSRLTGKTIVLVCHDAVEGLFDHVVGVGS